jgi:hypothetical protein
LEEVLYHVQVRFNVPMVSGLFLQAGIFILMEGTFQKVVPVGLEVVMSQDDCNEKTLFYFGDFHC